MTQTIPCPLCGGMMEAAWDGVQRTHQCAGLQDRMHEAFARLREADKRNDASEGETRDEQNRD